MKDLIRTFVRHPVAPNLAMMVVALAGAWAMTQLTRQLLPTFQLNVVDVSVVWTGASADDVEQGITQPLEDELIGLEGLSDITSQSSDGLARVSLEFPDSVSLGAAVERAKDAVAQIRNLPDGSEPPQISRSIRSEPVARVVISGLPLDQLRPLVKRLERELRGRGLNQLEARGIPDEEIAIELTSSRVQELGLTLSDIAERVRAVSRDVPAGSVGRDDVARQLRTLRKQRTVEGFEDVALIAQSNGRLLTVGDVATVTRRALPEQEALFVDGAPAAELRVRRSESEDALDAAQVLYSWVDQVQASLPPGVRIDLYDEPWRLVDERLDLMLWNGVTGLLLVFGVLFLFLNGRVALWVGIGIPVSLLAAFTVLWLLGGSLNMISLFAVVMALGIIVDDAIVVGEEAVTRFQAGAGPTTAAEQAAFRMLAPVTAASATTVAAFMPLLALDGATGSILMAIPLVVICVVIASLLECFLILPGHLRHSLQASAARQPSRFRRAFDVHFRRFRDQRFRRALQWSAENRTFTISLGVASLIVTLGLIGGGRVGFSFFPQPDGTTLFANVQFVAGSPRDRVDAFLDRARDALAEAEAATESSVVRLVVKRSGENSRGQLGSQLGHLAVELVPADQRETTNAELIRAWRERLGSAPGLERLFISSSTTGPPGADVAVELAGATPDVLKAAALDLADALEAFPGVSGIKDDTAFGKEQLVIQLNAGGLAAGLTEQSLSGQLRAAFDGELVQVFQDLGDEVEVRVRLAESERNRLGALDAFPIQLPDGSTATLSSVAGLSYQRGFDTLRHRDGQLAITVTADVDRASNNANAVRAELRRSVLPELTDRFGVSFTFQGDARNQRDTLGDVTLALPLALLLVYIILAWVFGSYVWPFAVLSVIPFGLVGGFIGHWLLDVDLTMLSIFGFFGLSGIVVNDSIILVTEFKALRASGASPLDAAVDAGVRRFRAVLLTSVTTVFGIMPILFEGAQQAQFLKPMVISLGFGLILATFMVLFLLPALLLSMETARRRWGRIRSRFPRDLVRQGLRNVFGIGVAAEPDVATAPKSDAGGNRR